MTTWKRIAGWPDYEVSDTAEVRSWKSHNTGKGAAAPKILGKRLDTRGYEVITLCNHGVCTRRYIHHLVLEAFVGPRPGKLECRHLDGNRVNNLPENLEWSTRQVNMGDLVPHGTRPRGEKHGMAKLTREQVLEIRQSTLPIDALGKKYGICRHSAWAIRAEKTWKHVKSEPSGHPPGSFELRFWISYYQGLIAQLLDSGVVRPPSG